MWQKNAPTRGLDRGARSGGVPPSVLHHKMERPGIQIFVLTSGSLKKLSLEGADRHRCGPWAPTATHTSKSHPLPQKCGGPQHPSFYPGNGVEIHAVAFPLCENPSVLTKETSPSSPSPSASPPVRSHRTAWGMAHTTLEVGRTVSVKAFLVRLDRFQLAPDAGLPSQVWAPHSMCRSRMHSSSAKPSVRR